MARDLYEVLSVARTASADEIKTAYRRLAREHHPDRHPDRREEAQEMMAEINQAYTVLSDSEKRAQYDRFGSDGPGVNFGGGGAGAGGLNDIFDVFFGGVAAAANARERSTTRRGADLRYDLELTLEEAWAGVSKDLHVPTMLRCGTCEGKGAAPGTPVDTCTACKGTGRLRQVRQTFFGQFVQEAPCARCGGSGKLIPTPCPTCRGEGRVRGSRDVSVRIPAGIDEGDRLRVPGAGEDAPGSGEAGTAPGDLYCFVTLRDSAQFVRDGETVLSPLPLSYAQAALGDTIEVPTLELDAEGEPVIAEVLVPAGTQGGAQFRVPSKGFPGRTGVRGDQVCVTHIVVPRRLNDRQKELLREFAAEADEMPEEHPRGFFDRLKDAIRGD